jgi:hypothetical protein
MSMFASDHTQVVTPPSDPKASITIQKLSGRAVEYAQAKHAEGAYDGFNGRGWSNRFVQKVMSGVASEADVQAVVSDPLAGYDRVAVVLSGIKSWSYEATVSIKTVADIDDETLEFLAIEIMRLTKPQLFLAPEERQAIRKNG